MTVFRSIWQVIMEKHTIQQVEIIKMHVQLDKCLVCCEECMEQTIAQMNISCFA